MCVEAVGWGSKHAFQIKQYFCPLWRSIILWNICKTTTRRRLRCLYGMPMNRVLSAVLLANCRIIRVVVVMCWGRIMHFISFLQSRSRFLASHHEIWAHGIMSCGCSIFQVMFPLFMTFHCVLYVFLILMFRTILCAWWMQIGLWK